MTLRTGLVVLLALVFGVSATIGVKSLITDKKSESTEEDKDKDRVEIVIAAVEIPRGTVISAESLKTEKISKESMKKGAITRIEDAIGRLSAMRIIQDDPIMEGKLAAKGSRASASSLITEKMRHVTIQTPNVASAGVFVSPGDKVDVLWTVQGQGADDPTGGGVTIRLLQNVEVFAVDKRIDPSAEVKSDAAEIRSVTLLVSPNQDAKLAQAQARGTLQLSVRNPDDDTAVDQPPVRMIDINSLAEKPKPKEEEKQPIKLVATPPAPKRPAQIELIRGNYQVGSVYVLPLESEARER
jgi:pilus assembly protein CpaB